jgi:hypothetical protein
MAVYDGHLPLARMGRDGLQAGETPLVTQFEKAFATVQNRK